MCAWEVTYANGAKEVFQAEPMWAKFDPMLRVKELDSHVNAHQAEFEAIAKLHGFDNFNKIGSRYCHNDLHIFYRGWVAGKSSPSMARN